MSIFWIEYIDKSINSGVLTHMSACGCGEREAGAEETAESSSEGASWKMN